MHVAEFCEIVMIVSFGISWPLNVIKAYRSRTTRGVSLPFLLLIFIGYLWGIAGKLLSNSFKWYVLFFYVFNAIMLSVNLLIYIRNYRIDQAQRAS